MSFIRYPHLERFGTPVVFNIEFGITYVFPKLDGTNASVWFEDGRIRAGSRNRELDTVNPGNRDNAGFAAWVHSDHGQSTKLRELVYQNQQYIFYGEWLVPHTIKHYRKDAWNKFYIFDVYDRSNNKFICYDDYASLLDQYGVDYIPCVKKFKNGSYDNFLQEAKQCKYLLEDGENQVGEGIVIKNYDWTPANHSKDVTWAKIVLEQFKDDFHKVMGANLIENKTPAQVICDTACTDSLIRKEYAKIIVEEGSWSSHYIPRLLHTVFYCVVTEELWGCLKQINYGAVNFQELKQLCILKVKHTLPEIF